MDQLLKKLDSHHSEAMNALRQLSLYLYLNLLERVERLEAKLIERERK